MMWPWARPRSVVRPIAILVFACVAALAVADQAAGHGTSSEILPLVDLNGNLVALEISSSAPPPPETSGLPPETVAPGDDLQISMELTDFDTKIAIRDVTFLVQAELGGKFLFEREFRADGGSLVFNFVSSLPEETDIVIETEETETDIFSYLLGTESRVVHVKGPRLADGGLYTFEISILTAGDYTEPLAAPIRYDSGISIPQITRYNISDPDFGEQYIKVATYYDSIFDFKYNSEMKEISYSMPFEWSKSNIDQSYVVHEELIVPDTYGDLLVSGFDVSINGVDMSSEIVTVDDFFSGERIVHIIIPQREIYNIVENSTKLQNGMDFLIRPDLNYTRISSVTENGQFRIFVSWEPEEMRSGDMVKIMFEVTDIFLRNVPVAAEYEFSVTTSDGKTIFEQKGTSTDSRESPANVAEFEIPEGVSGITYLNFKNLDGNELARTTVPVVIDSVGGMAVVTKDTVSGSINDDDDVTSNADDGQTDSNIGNGNGGCLIATATYGTELAPQVQQLRELRDNVVLSTESGTAFMSGFNQLYYTVSPTVADIERENPMFRESVKVMLTPMLSSLTLLNHVNIDTEAEMFGYGISIIMLNIGMYVGIPASVILASIILRRHGRTILTTDR